MTGIAKRFLILLAITGTIGFCTLKQSAEKHSGTYIGQDTVPKPLGYVNDFENLLTPRQETVLDSIIRAYEKRTSVEIAVLTFDTTQSSRQDLEKFTLSVLNTWGIGKKEKNNGILLAVCPGYRFVRIENGYGIEKWLTNEETKRIIDTAILPYLKEGKYYDGILNGVNTLTTTLDRKTRN